MKGGKGTPPSNALIKLSGADVAGRTSTGPSLKLTFSNVSSVPFFSNVATSSGNSTAPPSLGLTIKVAPRVCSNSVLQGSLIVRKPLKLDLAAR